MPNGAHEGFGTKSKSVVAGKDALRLCFAHSLTKHQHIGKVKSNWRKNICILAPFQILSHQKRESKCST